MDGKSITVIGITTKHIDKVNISTFYKHINSCAMKA